ncbi:hypothetical protein ACFL0S_10815 [Thermodesulfobacteriota bacterium]
MPKRDKKIANTSNCKEISSQLPPLGLITEVQKQLIAWYKKHGRSFPWRKSSCSKYQYVISELLLQRTRAEAVAAFYPKFINEFPSWKHLETASIKQLQRYLKPLGLWKRRATSIKKLSQVMAKKNGRFPKTRDQLENLPGVGQYISNSILLLCHGRREPLLDTNMARVLERLFGQRKLADIRYDPYLQRLSKMVVDCETPKIINWGILDLAAKICLFRNPDCCNCPLIKYCDFYQVKVQI